MSTTSPTRTAQSIPTPSRASSRLPPSPVRESSPATAAVGNALSPRRPLQSLPTGSPSKSQQMRAVPSSPPLVDRPKGRARDLLRKHYGLGVGPPPALAGPSRPLDPMDMDSPVFDAKSYYEQLITTSSLPILLKKENELLSEIRQLDSERQSLVYNHHHELIDASDTIAAMKIRAEGLDFDLEKLKVAFSEISRLGAEIMLENPDESSHLIPTIPCSMSAVLTQSETDQI